jgi:hypothetical protein
LAAPPASVPGMANEITKKTKAAKKSAVFLRVLRG